MGRRLREGWTQGNRGDFEVMLCAVFVSFCHCCCCSKKHHQKRGRRAKLVVNRIRVQYALHVLPLFFFFSFRERGEREEGEKSVMCLSICFCFSPFLPLLRPFEKRSVVSDLFVLFSSSLLRAFFFCACVFFFFRHLLFHRLAFTLPDRCDRYHYGKHR